MAKLWLPLMYLAVTAVEICNAFTPSLPRYLAPTYGHAVCRGNCLSSRAVARTRVYSLTLGRIRASGQGAGGNGDSSDVKKKGWFSIPTVNKAQLAALGASAMLSYGAVSNVNMGVSMIMAWVTFGKSTGLSPLDAGQWPKFLAVYGGFWLAANFLRPFRMGIAVALTPSFDHLVGWLQRKFQMTKAAAFASTVFMVNIVGNLSFLCGGLVIATTVFGTPLMPTQSSPSIVHVRGK